ncbi:MAG TPA: cupin domain-containing protein [Phycisphaerae bacterium]|nr:cupin domain-containing protein [Phycisphaerae bacterium]
MRTALFVSLEETKRDPALTTRGDRKLLVTEVYAGKEIEATEATWRQAVPCPVMLMKDTESGVFTQVAKQTRHRHMIGTEIYLLLEGSMQIDVDEDEHTLREGDMIVVPPGALHEVRREGSFLCRVITVNCGGPKDRCEN